MTDSLKKKKEQLKKSFQLGSMCEGYSIPDDLLDRAIEKVNFNLSAKEIRAKARKRAAKEGREYIEVLREEVRAAIGTGQP